MNYAYEIALGLVSNFNKDSEKAIYAVNTKTIFPEYYSGEKDGVQCLDLDAFTRFHQAVESYLSKGLIISKQDKHTGIYKRISATPIQIKQLAVQHELVLKPEYQRRMAAALSRFKNSSCPQVRNWVLQQLTTDQLKAVQTWFRFDTQVNINQAEKSLSQLLGVCEAVSELREDVMMRNFSVAHLEGSKALEQEFKDKIAAIMAPEQYADGVPTNEILKTLRILQNPASVWIKGAGRIFFKNGDILTCSACPAPLALSREWVEQITRVEAKSLLTIENLTTFNDYPCTSETLIVFTSGYANSLVIKFLRKCAADNILQCIQHFGDMDAFGFEILRDLSTRTELRFAPYLMDLDTYHAFCIQAIPMTAGNRKLFQKLLENDFYLEADKALFQVLLTDNKILEQEGIGQCIAWQYAAGK